MHMIESVQTQMEILMYSDTWSGSNLTCLIKFKFKFLQVFDNRLENSYRFPNQTQLLCRY